MPTLADSRSYNLLAKLSASKIDPASGVISGATVAKAGVPALGKYITLDAKGAITRDPKLAKKTVQCFTDAKTLDTLMGAAQDAGVRVKCREDHDDSLRARIGYCCNFQRTAADTVSTDIKVFDKFGGRDLLFETAQETPDLIGLSIDALMSWELAEKDGEQIALMRIEALEAVDVVDAGAITPGGLLLKAGVDSPAKVIPESQTSQTMTPEEMLAEMKKMSDSYSAGIAECKAAIAKLSAPPAAPAKKDDDGDGDNDAMKASLAKVTEQLAAVIADNAKMKRTNAALGLRASVRTDVLASDKSAEDIEKMAQGQKGYLSLVAEHAETTKCKRSEAHIFVQKNHREVYAEHLKAKGVYDPNKVKAA